MLEAGSPAAGWQAPNIVRPAGHTACAVGRYGPDNGDVAGGAREPTMPTTLKSVVTKYLRSGSPAQRTREEYATTLRKWSRWGGAVLLEHLDRTVIREFLYWVHEDASRQGRNSGRTANKVRSHLRAVLSWAWEHDLVDALPRFPRLKPQRDAAGRRYLTKPEINALYFATHQMQRPRGVEPSLACRSLLASGSGGFLQLRGRYRHRLEDAAFPQANPLAAHLVGPAVSRSGGQGIVPVGLALLSPRQNGKSILATDEPDDSAALEEPAPRAAGS